MEQFEMIDDNYMGDTHRPYAHAGLASYMHPFRLV